MRRPEVAAAVGNVFISGGQGGAGSPLMASARDARLGSSAKSSRAGENGQGPRGRGSGREEEEEEEQGEGRAACRRGKKTNFPGCHTLSRHLLQEPCKRAAAPPQPRAAESSQSPTAHGCLAQPGLDTASLLTIPAGGRTQWPCGTQQDRAEMPAQASGTDPPRAPVTSCVGLGGAGSGPSSWLRQPETSELRLHEIFMK